MPVGRIPDSLADLVVPVADLVPYDRNPRQGNVAVIRESLAAHGQYRPIVVRKGTNEVLAGNHTLAAARELDWEGIAATYVECSDEDAARIVLVDNRAADLGTYDDAQLLAILRELDDADALAGTGYTDGELDDLAALLSETEESTATTDSGSGSDGPDPETDQNAWESTDLKEYATRYEEQGRRLVVLDYDRSQYARVTAALDKLRELHGVDSNSEAVALHLAELYPEVAP